MAAISTRSQESGRIGTFACVTIAGECLHRHTFAAAVECYPR